MHCTNCGNPINETDKFCAFCGHQLAKPTEEQSPAEEITSAQPATNETVATKPATTTQPAAQPKFSGLAITGFVLSLVGVWIAGIILGALGLIFSSIGLSETRQNKKRGKGLAIAGLIISIVDIVYIILFFASGYSAFEGGLI